MNQENIQNHLKEDINPETKKIYFSKTFLFIILLLSSLLILIVYSFSLRSKNKQLNEQNSNLKKKFTTSQIEYQTTDNIKQKKLSEEVKTKEASAAATIQSKQYNAIIKLKEELVKVFSGQVEYEYTKNSEDVNSFIIYRNEINASYPEMNINRNIIITSYKYIPGSIYENGYEGGKWEVNMDEWKNYLTGLTLETKEAKKVTSWGTDETIHPITVKSLSGKVYSIYDSTFKPSGSVYRNFVTFDSKNSQIIIVQAELFFEKFLYDEKSSLFQFDPNIEEFLISVEDALANFN